MRTRPDPHHRHRFPAEIIAHAVWLYHTFTLSLRDVELLLAERGIIVSYGGTVNLMVSGERRGAIGRGAHAAARAPVMSAQISKARARAARY
jgi:hypothetical protein